MWARGARVQVAGAEPHVFGCRLTSCPGQDAQRKPLGRRLEPPDGGRPVREIFPGAATALTLREIECQTREETLKDDGPRIGAYTREAP